MGKHDFTLICGKIWIFIASEVSSSGAWLLAGIRGGRSFKWGTWEISGPLCAGSQIGWWDLNNFSLPNSGHEESCLPHFYNKIKHDLLLPHSNKASRRTDCCPKEPSLYKLASMFLLVKAKLAWFLIFENLQELIYIVTVQNEFKMFTESTNIIKNILIRKYLDPDGLNSEFSETFN